MTEHTDRSREFSVRRERCGKMVSDVMDFVQAAAENAGAKVDPPTFEVRGVGITYWTRGHRFCRFDPKFEKRHVVVTVFPPADPDELQRAGLKFTREGTDGPWIWVADMRAAVRLVPFILRPHDTFAPPIPD